jgi:hypothetical protein
MGEEGKISTRNFPVMHQPDVECNRSGKFVEVCRLGAWAVMRETARHFNALI